MRTAARSKSIGKIVLAKLGLVRDHAISRGSREQRFVVFKRPRRLALSGKTAALLTHKRLGGHGWSEPTFCHRSGLYRTNREAVSSKLQSRPGAGKENSGAALVFRAHSQRERAHCQRTGARAPRRHDDHLMCVGHLMMRVWPVR